MARSSDIDQIIVISIDCDRIRYRSGRGGDSAVSEDSPRDEPVRVRGMQQRVPERAEPAAPPPWPQFAMEAATEKHERGAAQGVLVSRADVRPPRPVEGPG